MCLDIVEQVVNVIEEAPQQFQLIEACETVSEVKELHSSTVR